MTGQPPEPPIHLRDAPSLGRFDRWVDVIFDPFWQVEQPAFAGARGKTEVRAALQRLIVAGRGTLESSAFYHVGSVGEDAVLSESNAVHTRLVDVPRTKTRHLLFNRAIAANVRVEPT